MEKVSLTPWHKPKQPVFEEIKRQVAFIFGPDGSILVGYQGISSQFWEYEPDKTRIYSPLRT